MGQPLLLLSAWADAADIPVLAAWQVEPEALERLLDGLVEENDRDLDLDSLTAWASENGWDQGVSFFQLPPGISWWTSGSVPTGFDLGLADALDQARERGWAWFEGSLDGLTPLPVPHRVTAEGYNLGIGWHAAPVTGGADGEADDEHDAEGWWTGRLLHSELQEAYAKRIDYAPSLERRLMLLWLLREEPLKAAARARAGTDEPALAAANAEVRRLIGIGGPPEVLSLVRGSRALREEAAGQAFENLGRDTAAWIRQGETPHVQEARFRRVLRLCTEAVLHTLEHLRDGPPILSAEVLQEMLGSGDARLRLQAQCAVPLLRREPGKLARRR
jgi:hypothetical protein